MRGLLADVNVQGHLPYLRRRLMKIGLWSILAELDLAFVTFEDLGLHPKMDDRSLWNRCQDVGWVLFTENRNDDGPDSLQATVDDSWQIGHLPVLTIANKGKFEHNPEYARRLANDVAEILVDVAQGACRDQARIYVPRH